MDCSGIIVLFLFSLVRDGIEQLSLLYQLFCGYKGNTSLPRSHPQKPRLEPVVVALGLGRPRPDHGALLRDVKEERGRS